MVTAFVVTVEVVNSLLLIGMLAFARHAWLTMPPSVPFPSLGRAGRLNGGWDFKENVLGFWIFADVAVWLGTSLNVMAGISAKTLGEVIVLPFVFIFPGILFAFQRSSLDKARALEDAVPAEAREDAAQLDGQSG